MHFMCDSIFDILYNSHFLHQVDRCGFQFKVVAAFSHMTRVDDTFIKELVAEGQNGDSWEFHSVDGKIHQVFESLLMLGIYKHIECYLHH